MIPLDGEARWQAGMVVDTLRARLEKADLPAWPDEGACKWCDYKAVCGPHEEERIKHKDKTALEDVAALRGMR